MKYTLGFIILIIAIYAIAKTNDNTSIINGHQDQVTPTPTR